MKKTFAQKVLKMLETQHDVQEVLNTPRLKMGEGLHVLELLFDQMHTLHIGSLLCKVHFSQDVVHPPVESILEATIFLDKQKHLAAIKQGTMATLHTRARTLARRIVLHTSKIQGGNVPSPVDVEFSLPHEKVFIRDPIKDFPVMTWST